MPRKSPAVARLIAQGIKKAHTLHGKDIPASGFALAGFLGQVDWAFRHSRQHLGPPLDEFRLDQPLEMFLLHADLAKLPIREGKLPGRFAEHLRASKSTAQKGEEGYLIVDGKRRYLAAKALGLATVPCRVLPKLSKEEYEGLRFELNHTFKPLTQAEKRAAAKRVETTLRFEK